MHYRVRKCAACHARPHSTPLDTLPLLNVRFKAFSNTSHQQHLTLSLPCSCVPTPYFYLQQGEGDGPAMDLVRTVASVTDWATAAGVVPRVSAIIACACPPHALASVTLQDDLGSSSRDHVCTFRRMCSSFGWRRVCLLLRNIPIPSM
jgi:hypothetical protein